MTESLVCLLFGNIFKVQRDSRNFVDKLRENGIIRFSCESV